MTNEKNEEMKKIAIVGSGIGGTSAAFYLRRLLGQPAHIDIYEKEAAVGGRIRHTEIAGTLIEIGAGFFHALNYNMLEFVDMFGLEKKQFVLGTMGIWDGKDMVFQTRQSMFLTYFKMLFRYGFKLLRLAAITNEFKKPIPSLYEDHEPFESLDDMLKYLGWQSLFQLNFQESMDQGGLGARLTHEIGVPTVRYIYHQSGERAMNGVSGGVSLWATDGQPIYSVVGGNQQLCERLVTASEAELHLDEGVAAITKGADGRVSLKTAASGEVFYDDVILATPIEVSGIELEGIDLAPSDRVYAQFWKSFVVGELNPLYFNMKAGSRMPNMIANTDDQKPGFRNEIMSITRFPAPNGKEIITVDARRKPTPDELGEIFSRIDEHQIHHVAYTFPRLAPAKLPPIVLAKGVYYLSGIDSISPCMEFSTIAARNIARLIERET